VTFACMQHYLLLSTSSPQMIVHRGSDAYSMCMHTVAVLFLLEIDNVIYAQEISAKLAAKFQAHHHMDISQRDGLLLERVKFEHFFLVPLFVVGSLLIIQHLAIHVDLGSFGAIPVTIVVFPLTSIICSACSGYLGNKVCRAIVVEAAKLGLIVVFSQLPAIFGLLLHGQHAAHEEPPSPTP
jgi:hypothetical protein